MIRLLQVCLTFVCAAVFAALVAGTVPVVAHAQQSSPSQASGGQTEVDFDEWEKVAQRAEEVVEAARASSPALGELRSELARWRERLNAAQDVNSSTISTVQRQLEALGPLPENGQESDGIAAQRQELTDRLGELQAPVRRAELAHSRADGLIKGIDQILRDRQTDALLDFGPIPLNPVHWPGTVTTLLESAGALHSEAVSQWSRPSQPDQLLGALPVSGILLLLGGVLLARGRRWSRQLTRRVLQDGESAVRWIAAFVVSLGSFAVPFFGLFLIVVAVWFTGLLGTRTQQFIETVLYASLIYLVARWLASRIFPSDDVRSAPLCLEEDARWAGRWYGALLGLVMGLHHVLERVKEIFGWSEAAGNVVFFPLAVLAALLLWRLGGLLVLHSAETADDSGEETHRARMTRLLGRLLVVLAVIAPVLAAVGYVSLSKFLLFPSVLTLMGLAALVVLQRLVIEIYAAVTGNRAGAGESLIPVVVGSVLVLLSMPVFALIWGARVTDLTELWTQFVDGVTIGDTRISPTIFLTLAIVFVFGLVATRLLQGALKNSVLPKTKIDPGGRNAIVSGIGYVGIFLAALIAITSAGIDLSSLAIVAGALSVGIGFGLQNIVSNFVSGIILLIERPISEGDWIEVGGQHGTVRDISVRSTRIETFDRTDVIVPNADFVSGTVTNYTRGNTIGRVIVSVGVAYGTDTRRVEEILLEIAKAHPLVLLNPAPYIVFQNFGASSLDFEIRAILRDVNFVLNVKSDMNHEIARRFAEEGIEIPFAQQDIWLRNPEVLPGTAKPKADDPTPQEQRPPDTQSPAKAHVTGQDLADGDGDADGDGR
ncbi:mechanosensitive ion channel family protein [Roseovarius gahaiensis]|uniref:Mechanosensitive ion channel family protein n=1 Tax=Roseovarius gahaiensis TaxID=2716691 RepID=A0A967EK94_9RHOB|nr:DUF3772 domain-containing protein [Roseovarius gahaiensis]NHQ75962.1 mechanosensitive ion channel family protein [Roseovarius gahaiensis]